MRILFVVHRYYPFPGGSEYYVRDMAEELSRRGFQVGVLAHEHQGDQNGIQVTNDYQMLLLPWDLIIIHGSDCISQATAHLNAEKITAPVLYLIVKPSESELSLKGLNHHRFLGYSTSMDIDYLKKHNVIGKGRRVRHGIVPETTIIDCVTRDYNKKIFVSAGGYWPHKAMTPLAEAFTKANIPNAELHLYGYGEQHLMPAESDNVRCYFGRSREDVMEAIFLADAYIMNSYEEGFGLVLLESMMNNTPWYARDIAGAHDMRYHGTLYKDEEELMELLRNHKRDDRKVKDAFDYVMANHTIQDTVNDIEDILLETLR